MLSLKLIESSSVAVSYYEKDDYYTAGQDALRSAGEWFGRGVDYLDRGAPRIVGLEVPATGLKVGAPVQREDLKALLDGVLPDGTQLGRIIQGERVHTAGWDLTFSAPKSVSILTELGGDERLRQAHQAAVKATLTWIEREQIEVDPENRTAC